MYHNELNAIVKANRYRSRKLFDESLIDFSSNDYLGFAENKTLFERAVTQVSMYRFHAPKASLLVNGYHPIHEEFEDFLIRQSGFEAAIVCGSGFLANFSLIESLARKKDVLILDEEYHASGMVASKTVDAKVVICRHNDAEHLEEILQTHTYQRAIIAVEGIYSMSGELLNPAMIAVADQYNALIIVDEAHSVGVVGEHLRGVFDLWGITPKENHVKMGTLGKALGSYGAYILCSSHISEFLLNRAKAIIYTTAPSLFDIALGYQGLLYILKHQDSLRAMIRSKQAIMKEKLGISMPGLIGVYHPHEGSDVVVMQEKLKEKGFLVGAIRPPTVERSILRIIPRINQENADVMRLCDSIKELCP